MFPSIGDYFCTQDLDHLKISEARVLIYFGLYVDFMKRGVQILISMYCTVLYLYIQFNTYFED